MINLKNPAVLAFTFAIIFHFTFYLSVYGPEFAGFILSWVSVLALISVFILIYLLFRTNWQNESISRFGIGAFIFFLLIIVVNYLRGFITISGYYGWKDMLLNPYIGLSLLPVLFYVVGLNANNFFSVNKIFIFYIYASWFFSLLYLDKFELQTFLLLPVFYAIMLYPLQSKNERTIIFVIAVTTFILSLTNRTTLIRLILSYVFILFPLNMVKIPLFKKVINIITVTVLILPFYFLFEGISGKSIFQQYASSGPVTQENLLSDSRTFLYYEVLTDLNYNHAFLIGKGINAGYKSDNFNTDKRTTVEVGFLQILLKTGFIGFLAYFALLISAVYNAFRKSNNIFCYGLGLTIVGYLVLFFLENVIAFNLLNIIIWFIVGVLHSKDLLLMSDKEIKYLYKF